MDMGVTEPLHRLRVSRISPDSTEPERDGWVPDTLLKNCSSNSPTTPLLDSSVPLPRAHFVKVPHVQQLCNWDCGLACVLMVLKTLAIEGQDIKSLSKLCCTSSVWTVDLAHLLRVFDVEVAFLTVTIGANPNYVDEKFYKENMDEDVERVNKLFEKAPQVGVRIQRRSISSEELSMLILSGQYLAIALVDKRKLSYPWLEELCLSDCCGLNTGYIGHYIVISGFDMDLQEFEIQDPASSSECGRISSQLLDEARTTFGTDEDILLISLNNHEKGSKSTVAVSLNSPA